MYRSHEDVSSHSHGGTNSYNSNSVLETFKVYKTMEIVMVSLKEKIKELEATLASRIEYNKSLDKKIAAREEEARKDRERIAKLESQIAEVEKSISDKERLLNDNLKDELEEFINKEDIVLEDEIKGVKGQFNDRSIDEVLSDPQYEGNLDAEAVGELVDKLHDEMSKEEIEKVDRNVNKNLKKKTLPQLKAARQSMDRLVNVASSNVKVLDSLIEEKEQLSIKLLSEQSEELSEDTKDEWFRDVFEIEVPDFKLSVGQYNTYIADKFRKLTLIEKKFFTKWFASILPSRIREANLKHFPPD